MQTTIGKTTLCLVNGDIAEQDTDAVVTAAHWRLNKGMAVASPNACWADGMAVLRRVCRRS